MTDGDITTQLRDRYLDLMMRSLTGALAEDNDSVIGGVRTLGQQSLKKRAANAVAKAAAKFDVELAVKKPYDADAREHGRDWPSRAESMIGLKRMANIKDCIAQIAADDVPGDLIETGVWRGGAVIFMQANLKAWGLGDRKVWVADSFQGLPAPDVARFPADAGDRLFEQEGLSVGVSQVKHNFQRYGLLDDNVVFLEGWFKDTLPTAPVEQLSLLRLDGDMYESTWQAIEALYPKLAPGGFCIVDDWGFFEAQAQQACIDYRAEHDITDEVIDIDGCGAYWRKS